MKKPALLNNPVLEYAWGSRSFIPELMAEPAPAARPQAELWMGAHPRAPSRVLLGGDSLSLPELIHKDPVNVLGESVAGRFSNVLPFLFKVLAMDRPLSIQAHPGREQAEEGFKRENRLNIPLDSPERNYRDANHKPELLCALRPFRALKGFRRVPEILSLLDRIHAPALLKEAGTLEKNPDKEGLKGFFTALMTMERAPRRRIIAEAVASCEKSRKSVPALQWVVGLNRQFPGDVGVLSPLLLNLVELRPGEAVFIHPGEPHAYLEGAGLEVMANSDNVLRGGLTPKHVDVPELLGTLNYQEEDVPILRPEERQNREWVYPSPAKEFSLSRIDLRRDGSFEGPEDRSVEILISVDGDARIIVPASGDVVALPRGASAIVPAAAPPYRITGGATIYKVTVPGP